MEARRQVDSANGDVFHDGARVLDKVRAWHKVIISAARTWDQVTPQIVKVIDEQVLIENPQQRGTAKVVRARLNQILSSGACSDAGTRSGAKTSVEPHLQSSTFAQLFNPRERNDLLLRLWQLPSYREREKGSVVSINAKPRDSLTDKEGSSIRLVTVVESADPRPKLSLSTSRHSNSRNVFGWRPDISPGSAVSRRGEPRSQDRTEDPLIQSVPSRPADPTTSQNPSDEQNGILGKIIAATRAHNFDEVKRLSSGNLKVLKEQDESKQTLMDHLCDVGKSGGEGFDGLFRLFDQHGVKPEKSLKQFYTRKLRKLSTEER